LVHSKTQRQIQRHGCDSTGSTKGQISQTSQTHEGQPLPSHPSQRHPLTSYTSRHIKVSHSHHIHLRGIHLHPTPADASRSVTPITSILEASTYALYQQTHQGQSLSSHPSQRHPLTNYTSKHIKVSHSHYIHLRGIHLPTIPADTSRSVTPITSISEASTYILHQQTHQGQSLPSHPS